MREQESERRKRSKRKWEREKDSVKTQAPVKTVFFSRLQNQNSESALKLHKK